VARIVILGAGMCGLAAGTMLARDGHEVTLLERDDRPAPESAQAAWEDWARDGVVQFRQAHFLASRGRIVLEETLPDVLEALIAAGATRFDPLAQVSAAGNGSGPVDERFVTYTARRPVMEGVFVRAAEAQPGLELRRGVNVTELVIEARDGTPHVAGAGLEGGEIVAADLVVDAAGRGSQLPRWLEQAGVGPLHEESEDSGFIYYSRFFHATNGSTPQALAPLLSPFGTFSLLTLPGDNDTWSVTAYTSTGDRPLKRMREADVWSAVVRACPLQAHWLDGEPISGIEAMGGVIDRYRRPVADGGLLVTGLALLGDAWACTNPSLGRGISLGLLHAKCLRETVAGHIDDPLEFAEAWDTITEEQLTPWYRDTVAEDRGRLAEIVALREDREPPGPEVDGTQLRPALLRAMLQDPELLTAFIESRCCLTSVSEVIAREGVLERVRELAAQSNGIALPGPDREELLRLVA